MLLPPRWRPPVEVDETYIGVRDSNKHLAKKLVDRVWRDNQREKRVTIRI